MKISTTSALAPLLCGLLLACGGEDAPAPTGLSMSSSSDAAATAAEKTGDYNEAPVITSVELMPDSPNAGDRVTAVVEAHDPDGDPVQLSFEWTVGGLSLSERGSEILLRDVEKGERVEVSVVARDGQGESDSMEQSATIGNRAPVLLGVVFEPLGEVSSANDIHARPRANDMDGDLIEFRYEWTVNGSRVHEDSEILPASEFSRGDEIRVRVWADDGETRSDVLESDGIRVVNAPPRIVSHPQGFDGEGSFRYVIEVEDPDQDRLFHYRLLSGPAGMSLDSTNAILSWTPETSQAGKHLVKLEVDDRRGGRVEQTFELTLGFDSSDTSPASPTP